MKLFTNMLIVLLLCFIMPSITNADALVNFSLSLNNNVDSGSTYTGFHESGRGTRDVYDVGFQVKINSINGTNVNLGLVAAYCSELQQDINVSSYNFKAQPLSYLAGGLAGVPGTASENIPVGGIGIQRAAYLSYLFDQYYIAEDLSKWTCTVVNPFTQAFQLAVWEITHDNDMSLRNTSGYLYIAAQSDTQRNNAINLASSMLQDIIDANISSTYVSTNFNICALTDSQYQDIILATKKDSILGETITPMLNIPEPTVASLYGIFFIVLLAIRRRFCV